MLQMKRRAWKFYPPIVREELGVLGVWGGNHNQSTLYENNLFLIKGKERKGGWIYFGNLGPLHRTLFTFIIILKMSTVQILINLPHFKSEIWALLHLEKSICFQFGMWVLLPIWNSLSSGTDLVYFQKSSGESDWGHKGFFVRPCLKPLSSFFLYQTEVNKTSQKMLSTLAWSWSLQHMSPAIPARGWGVEAWDINCDWQPSFPEYSLDVHSRMKPPPLKGVKNSLELLGGTYTQSIQHRSTCQ